MTNQDRFRCMDFKETQKYNRSFIREILIVVEEDNLDYGDGDSTEGQFYVYAETQVYFPLDEGHKNYQVIPIKSGGVGGIFEEFEVHGADTVFDLKRILKAFNVIVPDNVEITRIGFPHGYTEEVTA